MNPPSCGSQQPSKIQIRKPHGWRTALSSQQQAPASATSDQHNLATLQAPPISIPRPKKLSVDEFMRLSLDEMASFTADVFKIRRIEAEAAKSNEPIREHLR